MVTIINKTAPRKRDIKRERAERRGFVDSLVLAGKLPMPDAKEFPAYAERIKQKKKREG